MSDYVFSFTQKGGALAKRISELLPQALHVCDFSTLSLRALMAEIFPKAQRLIFVGATGIAVRVIAPYITTKDKDPAVIAVDELGRYFIPLLSGHIGGANQAALFLAKEIGGTAVISTATDLNRCFAVDLWACSRELGIYNIGGIKHVSAAVLRGEPVALVSCEQVKEPLPPFLYSLEQEPEEGPAIVITEQAPKSVRDKSLYLIPRQYALGIGCRRDTDPEIFEETILNFLGQNKIEPQALMGLASIELKAEEPAILSFARKYRLKFNCYSAEELLAVPGSFAHSDFVKKTTGADNVCERSAVCLAGGSLLVGKTAQNGITMALAARNRRCELVSFHDWHRLQNSTD